MKWWHWVLIFLGLFVIIGAYFISNFSYGISEDGFAPPDYYGLKEQMFKSLEKSGDRMYLSEAEIIIKKQTAEDVGIAIKNTHNQSIIFSLHPEIVQPENTKNGLRFFYDNTSQSLKVGEKDLYNIKITSLGQMDQYQVKIKVLIADGAEYASKSFFVNVVE